MLTAISHSSIEFYNEAYHYTLEVKPSKGQNRLAIIDHLRHTSEIADTIFTADGLTIRWTNTRALEQEIIKFSQYYPTCLFILKVTMWAGEQIVMLCKNAQIKDYWPEIKWPDFYENDLI
jgi:hypothetical protein